MDTTDRQESRGVQTYRWIISMGLLVIGALCVRLLTELDKNTSAVSSLQIQVSLLSGTTFGRLDAQDIRLSGHDRRFDRIEDRVFLPGRMP